MQETTVASTLIFFRMLSSPELSSLAPDIIRTFPGAFTTAAATILLFSVIVSPSASIVTFLSSIASSPATSFRTNVFSPLIR